MAEVASVPEACEIGFRRHRVQHQGKKTRVLQLPDPESVPEFCCQKGRGKQGERAVEVLADRNGVGDVFSVEADLHVPRAHPLGVGQMKVVLSV